MKYKKVLSVPGNHDLGQIRIVIGAWDYHMVRVIDSNQLVNITALCSIDYIHVICNTNCIVTAVGLFRIASYIYLSLWTQIMNVHRLVPQLIRG